MLNYVKKAIPIILILAKSRSFAKQSYMKKISLIATLFLAVLLLQNCKKDTAIGSTTSNEPMIADINDTTWTTDSVKVTLTYTAATQTKVLACQGTGAGKQINLQVTQHNANNTAGFPDSTNFYVNTTTDNLMSYEVEQKNSSGVYAFAPLGVVAPGSGSLMVTGINSVTKRITAQFVFSTTQNNYDSNNNIISVTVQNIQAGGFNNVPYTFISQ